MALAVVVTSAVAPGVVWNVSDVAELNYAMEYLGSGDEVVLGPGQYELDAGFTVNASNVTIRGATGNREQVVVYGGGMNDPTAIGEAFQLAAADQTIRDLTISLSRPKIGPRFARKQSRCMTGNGLNFPMARGCISSRIRRARGGCIRVAAAASAR